MADSEASEETTVERQRCGRHTGATPVRQRCARRVGERRPLPRVPERTVPDADLAVWDGEFWHVDIRTRRVFVGGQQVFHRERDAVDPRDEYAW
jgi:hypothetical protein